MDTHALRSLPRKLILQKCTFEVRQQQKIHAWVYARKQFAEHTRRMFECQGASNSYREGFDWICPFDLNLNGIQGFRICWRSLTEYVISVLYLVDVALNHVHTLLSLFYILILYSVWTPNRYGRPHRYSQLVASTICFVFSVIIDKSYIYLLSYARNKILLTIPTAVIETNWFLIGGVNKKN